jgi:hypothetical protein
VFCPFNSRAILMSWISLAEVHLENLGKSLASL